MPTVHLPAALAGYAGGRRRVQVDLPGGGTLATLLAALGDAHPGVRDRVMDERGRLRRHVNVFVNGESVRWLDGLATPVGGGDEVWVIPAVSGGA
jgi:molybdopterin synthase sulfur carrier subunit